VVGDPGESERALSALLQRIAEATGWTFAQAWLPDEKERRLRCGPAWHASTSLLNGFRRSCLDLAFEPGLGSLGQAWVDLKPLWLADLLKVPLFRRREAARKARLRSALIVPALAQGRLRAVLEFLGPKRRRESAAVRDLAAAAAAHWAATGPGDLPGPGLEWAGAVASVGLWTLDLRRREAWWNEHVYRLLGYSPREVKPGMESWSRRVHPDDLARVRSGIDGLIDAGQDSWSEEYRILLPDGAVRRVLDQGRVARDAANRPLLLAGTVLDITERTRAEEALRTSESRFRRIFESRMLGILYWDSQGNISDANEAFLEIVDRSPEELRERRLRWTDLTPPEHEPKDRRALEELRECGVCTPYEKEYYRRDGSRVPVLIGGAVFEEERDRGVAFVLDVSRRRQAEQALRESNARFQGLYDSGMVGIMFWDLSGGIWEANDEFLRIVGYSREDLKAGRVRWSDMTPPEFRAGDERAYAELLARGTCTPFRKEYLRRDGSRVPVYLGGTLLEPGGTRGVSFVLDLTENQRLEKQFLQAQKMESVGRLAGGIAHDFNNLLTSILGYAALAQGDLEEADPIRRHLDEILKAGARASELTRKLLAFSRRQVLAPKMLDLDALVGGVEGILRRMIGEDVDLTIRPGSGLPPVKADPVQLEQVLMNFVVNARDAMPGGGRLSIATSLVELGADSGLPAGTYVALRVTDSGTGMEPAVLSRLFEPYFTTKEVGKGTGLGLSTAYGIVRQSGGTIRVESRPGQGSTFEVLLPAAAPGPLTSADETAASPEILRGTGTILLVEDDARVRTLAAEILRHAGYRVVDVADPEAAARETSGSICS
jgi:PAS domain S-box-containing protein